MGLFFKKQAPPPELPDHGSAWRSANAGHVSLHQLKVMSAIERCRTAALGGRLDFFAARSERDCCGSQCTSYGNPSVAR
jgi:hypothetical protein